MKKIFEWLMNECKELEIRFDWDLYINSKNMWLPIFNYAKTWKLYWRLGFISDIWRYEILLFNNYYIQLLFSEKIEAKEWDLSF